MRIPVLGFGLALLVATSGCTSSSAGAGAKAPYRHYHSRADLKPPTVQIVKRARRTAPGYIFIAPKKDVVQAGPMILDSLGRVIWFEPLDTHGVTDFRVQRYRGRPVLTWWHGRSDAGGGASGYPLHSDSYRLR